jgi:uncharacterized short protein YbdD (DUF466 family)
MALGGQHRRQTVDQSPGIAHYAGTPQGRLPEETGAFGCTVVSVDESGHVKTNFVAVDVVRFITETIELTAGADVKTLMPQFDVRVNNLKSKHPDRDPARYLANHRRRRTAERASAPADSATNC